jgi:hypothetical protein
VPSDAVEPHSLLEHFVVGVLKLVYFGRLQWLAFNASMLQWVVDYVVRATAREGVSQSARPALAVFRMITGVARYDRPETQLVHRRPPCDDQSDSLSHCSSS